MKIIFSNISKDLDVLLSFKDGSAFTVPYGSVKAFEIQGDSIAFAVKYQRDFTMGYQYIPHDDGKIKSMVTDKITEKAMESIGNTLVQIENTYKAYNLTENAVIELNDRCNYLSPSGLEGFMGCFPALYYFGQAECKEGNIKVLSSVAFNRPGFLSFYKFVYRTIDLKGPFFDFIKYKVQIDRQRKISSTEYLTGKFNEFYSMSFADRDYQFKPITVLTDKFIKFIKNKLPKRIRKKLAKKLKRQFNIK